VSGGARHCRHLESMASEIRLLVNAYLLEEQSCQISSRFYRVLLCSLGSVLSFSSDHNRGSLYVFLCSYSVITCTTLFNCCLAAHRGDMIQSLNFCIAFKTVVFLALCFGGSVLCCAGNSYYEAKIL